MQEQALPEQEIVELEADEQSDPAADDAAPKRRRPKPPSGAAGHWSLLIMSLVVVGLSLTLSVRGETDVVVPIINVPLPGMCTFQRLTGLDCPGCGLTRCFVSLAHGNVGRAWSYNPAGMLMFVVVVLQIPYRSWQLWRLRSGQKEAPGATLGFWTLVILAAAMLGQWAVKIFTGIVS